MHAPPPPDDLAAALERYADSALPPPRPRLREAAVMLLAACLVAVALDSEGLVGWARRQEVGRTQTALLALLEPLHQALGRVGLTAPRRWAASVRERLVTELGADPVLAEGWVPVGEAPPPPAPAPPVDAGVDLVPEPPLVGPPVVELAPREGGLLLLGDSLMAGSLGATVERAVAARLALPVTRATQLGTGLARPDLYDWLKVVPALLEREQPRFVVVALGANDGTNLLHGETRLDFGEARWREVYVARVEAMMRALTASGARVLWLGLPPMRDARLSSRCATLNHLFRVAARRVPRVEVLELDLLVGDGERRYATFVQARDGKLVRYRLDDGVHLAPGGARAVAAWVVDWLRERR